jgi:F-type H+/Na+-transporting ATPase subunit alpha
LSFTAATRLFATAGELTSIESARSWTVTNIPAVLDSWLTSAKERVKATALAPVAEQVGRVEAIADGIALVSGLRDVRLDELVRFEQGQVGFALTLGRDSFGCVLLDETGGLEAGHRVGGTGEVVRAPVGPALLGRTVDPLGRPLDGGGKIDAESHEPVERPAPSIIDRDFVNEPVQTGLLVLDSMFALGRGQRELIIGDRAIGKTAIAVDCIINQKTSDIICVYVAIGQKSSTIKRVINAIETHGAPERCIFVIASASAPPGLQWIAPFSGFTMAEYFRDRGQHALVVVDDMTKHAATHREIALPATSGARGLPRRRVLRPCPAAGACCEAFKGRRWRIVDCASNRRIGCWQFKRIHPDQFDFDHRRPDRS